MSGKKPLHIQLNAATDEVEVVNYRAGSWWHIARRKYQGHLLTSRYGVLEGRTGSDRRHHRSEMAARRIYQAQRQEFQICLFLNTYV